MRRTVRSKYKNMNNIYTISVSFVKNIIKIEKMNVRFKNIIKIEKMNVRFKNIIKIEKMNVRFKNIQVKYLNFIRKSER